MFVIARESSFYYKGKSMKIRQISEELGVRYVLEGSVQKSDDRIRVNAQLIDGVKGHHLWAENYDRKLSNLFALQDELTLNILKGMRVKLLVWDTDFIGGTHNLDAYLKLIEGKYHYFRSTKEDNLIARKLFEEAIALDPKYIQAYHFLGRIHNMYAAWGWSESPKESIAKAELMAKKVIAFDDSYYGGYRLMAGVHLFRGQYDRALSESKKAIALKQVDATNLGGHAFLLLTIGRPEEAIIYYEKSLRLNPYPRGIVVGKFAQTYHRTGRYEEALEVFKRLQPYVKRGKFPPQYMHVGMMLAYLELGQVEKAKAEAKKVLEVVPNFRFITVARAHYGYKDKDKSYLSRLLSPLDSILYPEGTGKNIYTCEGIPAFQFKYPAGSNQIETMSSVEFLRMKSPEGVHFTAGIVDIPVKMTLSDIGPKIFVPVLEKFGSKVEVISNEEILLQDGTQACRFEIKWLYANGRTWFHTTGVGAFNNNKAIILAVHPVEGHPTEVAWIVESLVFKSE